MSRLLIGWSDFSLRSRVDEMSSSIKTMSKEIGRDITPFTPQSDSGGKHRVGLTNPYVEHKKFFNDILAGDRKITTVVNYGMLLRHQLNIEFSSRKAISTPSKNSIIKDCGQYFYKEVFTKLFSPIVRGYKIDEKQTRNSTYSFSKYTTWLYAFIIQKYMKRERDQIFAILKEALGSIHDFFMQNSCIPSTSSIYNKQDSRLGSPSQNRLGEPRRENVASKAQTYIDQIFKSIKDYQKTKIKLSI